MSIGHERAQRLAIRRRHGQTKFCTPPEDIVRKTRPFLCHEIAYLRAGQFRPESRTEIGPLLGLAEDGRNTRSIGADQPLRLSLAEKTPALAGAIDLGLEPPPFKVAARQRRVRGPARRHRIERRQLRYRPLSAQPRSRDVAAEDRQQRRLTAPRIKRYGAIARGAPRSGTDAHVGAGDGPDHVEGFDPLAKITAGGLAEVRDVGCSHRNDGGIAFEWMRDGADQWGDAFGRACES